LIYNPTLKFAVSPIVTQVHGWLYFSADPRLLYPGSPGEGANSDEGVLERGGRGRDSRGGVRRDVRARKPDGDTG
jgi:hypothetical protein